MNRQIFKRINQMTEAMEAYAHKDDPLPIMATIRPAPTGGHADAAFTVNVCTETAAGHITHQWTAATEADALKSVFDLDRTADPSGTRHHRKPLHVVTFKF